jgi:hypothetical protein
MKTASCILMGGLGNQLFQIFATIAYCIEHNLTFVFPYSEFLHTGIRRPTYWHSFLQNLLSFTTNNPSNGYTNDNIASFPRYREPGFHYTKIPAFDTSEYASLQDLSLFGYYQSHKYFIHHEPKIYSLIQLDHHLSWVKLEYASLFYHARTISMHFRLGDYKHNTNFHPIMSYDYYKNSLMRMSENSPADGKSVRVLYFCEQEDNAYVNGIIDCLRVIFTHIEFQKVDDTIDDWKQMLIMSCCDDNIIANSSFSWWGAYLNPSQCKTVCYPSVWFGPGQKSATLGDLFPPQWTKISTAHP